MLIASFGDAVVGTVIVVGLCGLLLTKLAAYRTSRCRHCGHNNGLAGWQAPVCPACGRNKTVLNTRRAARR